MKADRPRYWRVSPQFWAKTAAWGEDPRTLALYLLTCPHRTTEGLFRLPMAYMTDDLGWPAKRLTKAFDQLLDKGFVQYDPATSVLLLVKALKYQSPENPNQVTAARRRIEELPPSTVDNAFLLLAEQFCKPLAQGLPERFTQGSPEGYAQPLSLALSLAKTPALAPCSTAAEPSSVSLPPRGETGETNTASHEDPRVIIAVELLANEDTDNRPAGTIRNRAKYLETCRTDRWRTDGENLRFIAQINPDYDAPQIVAEWKTLHQDVG